MREYRLWRHINRPDVPLQAPALSSLTRSAHVPEFNIKPVLSVLLAVVTALSVSCGQPPGSRQENTGTVTRAEDTGVTTNCTDARPVPKGSIEEGEILANRHCIACHAMPWNSDPFASAELSTVLHGSSVHVLTLYKDGRQAMGPLSISATQAIMEPIGRRDLPKLAAYIASRDQGCYVIRGTTLPNSKITASAPHNPGMTVDANRDGTYELKYLLPGDYIITAKTSTGQSIQPEQYSIFLDFVEINVNGVPLTVYDPPFDSRYKPFDTVIRNVDFAKK